jgi:hypothetical protein
MYYYFLLKMVEIMNLVQKAPFSDFCLELHQYFCPTKPYQVLYFQTHKKFLFHAFLVVGVV